MFDCSIDSFKFTVSSQVKFGKLALFTATLPYHPQPVSRPSSLFSLSLILSHTDIDSSHSNHFFLIEAKAFLSTIDPEYHPGIAVRLSLIITWTIMITGHPHGGTSAMKNVISHKPSHFLPISWRVPRCLNAGVVTMNSTTKKTAIITWTITITGQNVTPAFASSDQRELPSSISTHSITRRYMNARYARESSVRKPLSTNACGLKNHFERCCPDCDREFNDTSGLRMHMNSSINYDTIVVCLY